jgi:hypothetical protein
MGAYGGTAEASKSYFGEPLCKTIIAGDINGDCRVDFGDFELIAFRWLEGASTVNSNRMVTDGIVYYMQTDKSAYHLGESVRMLFRVTNLRNAGENILCSQIPEFNFLVKQDGETIWMRAHGGYTGFSTVYVAAGASETVNYNWDMKDDNGSLVEPGIYDVVGVIYNQPWNYHNGRGATITEVAVSITIIP